MRVSVCMLISSYSVYGGPILSACPLTQCGEMIVCFVLDRMTLTAAMAYASGIDWLNTPSLSLFQMRSSADSMSHTC
jgi:hypothetical protein